MNATFSNEEKIIGLHFKKTVKVWMNPHDYVQRRSDKFN